MPIRRIVHNKPSLGIEEANIASSVINSGWIAQGSKTQEFENNICEFLAIQKGSAIAVTNGTSALYLSLKVLNLPKSSEVILPSYVCSALLNAIYLADLVPILVDVNDIDINIDINIVRTKLSSKTKAIILPHMYGVPVNIIPFLELKKKGIYIIEDCATAIGAKIEKDYVGTLADIAIFSFYASKFITSGSGGMIVSKDERLINKARNYREFDGVLNYEKRFNFQITDIQSAIGNEQLKKIGNFLARRKEFAHHYADICDKKGWDYQRPSTSNMSPNNYRFVLKLDKIELLNLQGHLHKNNIDSIIPIEKFELLHNYLKLGPNEYKIAELLSETTLSIPIYPVLSDAEFTYILDTLNNY